MKQPSPIDPGISRRKRNAVGLSLMLVIVFIHLFRLGSYLKGPWNSLYYSYFSDLILPFGAYFLLCIAEFNLPLLRKWFVKAAAILGLTTLAEILQYFDIYALGITFDYLDLVMYFTGVGIAVLVDRLILKNYLNDWEIKRAPEWPQNNPL